jgi:hypothetical protein
MSDAADDVQHPDFKGLTFERGQLALAYMTALLNTDVSAAVTQVAHDTPGRAYYERKLAEGKSRKEALRAAEASGQRRPSTGSYARTSSTAEPGPGGQPGTTLESSVAG